MRKELLNLELPELDPRQAAEQAELQRQADEQLRRNVELVVEQHARKNRRVTRIAAALGLISLLCLVTLCYREAHSPRMLRKYARGDMYAIKDALDKYQRATGGYPVALQELRERGYLGRLRNAYSGGKQLFVRPGEPAVPGGVSYLVWRNAAGVRDGYCLFIYGDRPVRSSPIPVHPEELRLWPQLPLDYCITRDLGGARPAPDSKLEAGQP